MHVNNWEPDTYLWILQDCDVPYVPDEWTKLLGSYAKDPTKVTGMTILGRYLSKMRLKQYKDYRWKDTQFLQDLSESQLKEAMKRQGYEAAEITEAIERSKFNVPENAPPPPEPVVPQEDYFDTINDTPEDTSIVDALTDEDKLYLRMKWGKTYKPYEWVELEKLYNEMMETYDIQTAGHRDTLKLVCKTSLKSN
jgi:hypothetical protein